MPNVKLSLACYQYDRTEPLLSGEVRSEGIDLEYVNPSFDGSVINFPFRTMFVNPSYDATEVAIGDYIMNKTSAKSNLTAIPVFPMRAFFHSMIVVNTQSRIRDPIDLKGKKVGLSEYMTGVGFWTRGVLEHEFGVSPSDIEWVEERKKGERIADALGYKPPENVTVHSKSEDSDLVTMLFKGEIDALPTNIGRGKRLLERIAAAQRIFGREKIRPLFNDQKAEAKRFYRKTGLFPANHVIVVRNDILEKNPWVAQSLYDAFLRAKQLSYKETASMVREPANLVWLGNLYDEVAEIFGEDPYPYGIRSNQKMLDTAIDYALEQGYAARKPTISELFASDTLAT
ncbi:MAG: hypothetical protein ACREBS_04715 [Nitrososphaerales archaeon]